MKFLLVLILAFISILSRVEAQSRIEWGYPTYLTYGTGRFRYRKALDTNPSRIECIFMTNTNKLSCSRGSILNFECEAIQNMAGLDVNYDYLAITVNDSQITLYPVSFTDMSISNGQPGLSIYPDGSNGNGFMIRDQSCFHKMHNVFRTMQQQETNPITGNMVQKDKVLGSVVIERLNKFR